MARKEHIMKLRNSEKYHVQYLDSRNLPLSTCRTYLMEVKISKWKYVRLYIANELLCSQSCVITLKLCAHFITQ